MRCDPHASRTRTIDLVERAAVGASLLCLVHCAGLPLLLAALPALSRMVAIPEALHLWLLAFAIPSSALALIAGYRRHDQPEILALGGAGLALMAAAVLLFAESAA
ncbi:MAG: MerC domain-containing protein, partial [Methyloversatilis sp.]|nr:MerC domain-containing protein [Methyloversatilis sp.]